MMSVPAGFCTVSKSIRCEKSGSWTDYYKNHRNLSAKKKLLTESMRRQNTFPLERLYLSPQCGFASCEIGNKTDRRKNSGRN